MKQAIHDQSKAFTKQWLINQRNRGEEGLKSIEQTREAAAEPDFWLNVRKTHFKNIVTSANQLLVQHFGEMMPVPDKK